MSNTEQEPQPENEAKADVNVWRKRFEQAKVEAKAGQDDFMLQLYDMFIEQMNESMNTGNHPATSQKEELPD